MSVYERGRFRNALILKIWRILRQEDVDEWRAGPYKWTLTWFVCGCRWCLSLAAKRLACKLGLIVLDSKKRYGWQS